VSARHASSTQKLRTVRAGAAIQDRADLPPSPGQQRLDVIDGAKGTCPASLAASAKVLPEQGRGSRRPTSAGDLRPPPGHVQQRLDVIGGARRSARPALAASARCSRRSGGSRRPHECGGSLPSPGHLPTTSGRDWSRQVTARPGRSPPTHKCSRAPTSSGPIATLPEGTPQRRLDVIAMAIAIERSLCIPHSALRTPHPALRTPHSALRTPHPALRTPHPAPRTPLSGSAAVA
jgi:hypothetical protein